MEHWNSKTLGEITLKIGSGSTPRGGSNSYKEEGISLIRSQNVLDLKFSYEGLAFIDEEQADRLKNVKIKSEDILLNITGDSVARVCMVPEKVLPARVNQHVSIIRVDKAKSNSKYVLYNLIAQKEELLMQSEVGATRKALTKTMLEQLEVNLPLLPEQKAIAEVLSSLDDKIDLLHRQNETLEQMAQTLFRQWFVERRPELVEGEAEEDWEEKPLSFFGDIICGKTPTKKKPQFFDGNIPFIKIPDMHGKTFVFDTIDTLTEEGKKSQLNKTIPQKSINVSCIATVGLVTLNAFESHTNQQINSIVPIKDEYRYYLYCAMKNMYDFLQALASGGTATLNLNTGNFSKIKIPLPNIKILKLFNDITIPIFDKIFENQNQIRTLEKLRDTLLPKLMSGEVRVKY